MSKSAIWALLAALLLLEGCNTITPDNVENKRPAFDSSTPDGYNPYNSGLIEYVEDSEGRTVGAIITTDARARYNALIQAYRLQFKDEYKIELNQDSGVEVSSYPVKTKRSVTDPIPEAKKLYFITSDYMTYFMRLSAWSKNKRDSDSIWLKIKEKVS